VAKVFCRALNCGMSFATSRHREQHQAMMHKDWVKEAAILLVDKINSSNSIESLNKKVIRTSDKSFSYSDAKKMMQIDDAEGKAILKTMMNVVETYFAHHDDWGVKELLSVSDFHIR
jgi:hypothetical protein